MFKDSLWSCWFFDGLSDCHMIFMWGWKKTMLVTKKMMWLKRITMNHDSKISTLLVINISQLRKRNIIFQATFKGADMLVPWRVPSSLFMASLTFSGGMTVYCLVKL